MAKLCDHGYFLEVAPRSCPKCRTDTDLALREEIYALRATIERLREALESIAGGEIYPVQVALDALMAELEETK